MEPQIIDYYNEMPYSVNVIDKMNTEFSELQGKYNELYKKINKFKIPYIIVGNHLTSYGGFLKTKYKSRNVVFMGGIFNKDILDNLRYYSKCYLHGHSVGGTNPALLEAMAAKAFILSHKNNFNESVVENNAFYFTNIDELVSLLQNKSLLDHKKEFITNNLTKIDTVYKWELIVNSYELYFQNILKEPTLKEISQS